MIRKFIKGLIKFFYQGDKDDRKQLNRNEFLKLYHLENLSNTKDNHKLQKAYEIAWDAKKMAGDGYWKRANYFWAFQAATFTGYFVLLTSVEYKQNIDIIYYLICIGVLTSFAWALTNVGSKTWQRKWQNIIELLEPDVTGPIYQISMEGKTFSISKINEIVSRFMVAIWLLIAFSYLIENTSLIWSGWEHVKWEIWGASIATFMFVFAMFFGYGRGRFGSRSVNILVRKEEI